MKFLCNFSLLVLVFACKISFAQNDDKVIVLPMKVSAPADAQKLGTITMGNNSTKMNCDYEALIAAMKKKALARHGNLIKITELVQPSFIGKCYKIKADIYSVKDISQYKPVDKKKELQFPANNNYATLYLYRLRDSVALITTYHVHLDKDSVIYFSRSRSRDSVRLYKEGPTTLWAEIESRREVKLNVKFGEEYYVRCGVENGELRMRPVLQLVDKNLGAKEFKDVSKGKKDVDPNYLNEIH